MKIRIKGNSVRLRLSQSDVNRLRLTGMIHEETLFVDSRFIYKLMRSNEHDAIAASFENGAITVFLPNTQFDDFVNTQQVGCGGDMKIGDADKLSILVEKDFKCLDNTLEDQSDNFPNPLAETYGKQQ